MKFIDEIVLKELSGSSLPVEMFALERINVICGKNSSGKTTILNSIHTQQGEKAIFGITELSQKNIEFYVEEFYKRRSQKDKRHAIPNAYQIVRNQFYEFFSTYKNGLKSDSFTSLVSDFLRFLMNRGIRPMTADNSLIGEIIGSIISERKTHLIPPKREFSSYSNIAHSDEVAFSSNHFLSTLFNAKNQLEGSLLRSCYDNIKYNFTEITGGYDFNIAIENSNKDVKLYFSHLQNEWRGADDYGLGLYEALNVVSNIELTDAEILLLEEPENHLHPEIQRRLFYYINQKEDKQFFITTHSNIFLDITLAERIFHTVYDEKITVRDDTNKAQVLQDIGYSVSDNLIADIVILTEGPTDKPILEEYFAKLGLKGKYNIRIWALGGDIMDKQDLSVFSDVYKVFAVIDRDPKSKRVRDKFMKMCEDLEIDVRKLERYAIENYFTVRALREVFKGQIPEEVVTVDPDRKLEDQIGLSCKNNNRKLAKEMTLDELSGTDLYDFLNQIIAFLEK